VGSEAALEIAKNLLMFEVRLKTKGLGVGSARRVGSEAMLSEDMTEDGEDSTEPTSSPDVSMCDTARE